MSRNGQYYYSKIIGKQGIEQAAVVLFLVVQEQLSDVQVRLVQDICVEVGLLGFLLLYSLQLTLTLAFLPQFQLQFGQGTRNGSRRPLFSFTVINWQRGGLLLFLEFLDGSNAVRRIDGCRCNFVEDGVGIQSVVVHISQIGDDGDKVVIFFLHLLVMAPALFCLSCSNKSLHSLEDLIHSPKMAVDKVFVVHLQKPMIFFVLLCRPMPTIQ